MSENIPIPVSSDSEAEVQKSRTVNLMAHTFFGSRDDPNFLIWLRNQSHRTPPGSSPPRPPMPAQPALSDAEAACLTLHDEPLPAGLKVIRYLNLKNYHHHLPETVIFAGFLDLEGYDRPLPTGLAKVNDLGLKGYRHFLPISLAGCLPVPAVPGIDRAMLTEINNGGYLEMCRWHTAATTHSRAGWAIVLAGKDGEALEKRIGTAAAAALIYQVSRPGHMFPEFYSSNEVAMADIISWATADLKA